ncbi:sensor histidine kinase [Lentiprolixibacter aurantiacus]|uniref:histidine kinase n=1 Tax=Lentiprolixibacter aurantiacus TaxID=2993939 RepID=A0AAE3MNI0_9FLAO|nr:PAS domain S-box protein [Lentiprolixibacter aurantiacus]MCX2720112.1 PAS domain S-box protein [Lentiprolixibacter aurantiacus]
MHVFEKNSSIFNLLSEAISDGVVVVNQEHEIVSINKHAQEFFGYTSEELLGKPMLVLIPDRFKKAHKDHTVRYFKTSKEGLMVRDRCLYASRKSGEEFPVNISLHPFELYERHYALALVRDMTEEIEIQRNIDLQTQAMDSAHNGIVITDALLPDNPIIYVNQAFEKITGYPRSEVLNKNCRFLQNNDREQEGIRKIRNCIKTGKSCQVRVRNYKKDGTLFWNEVSINPIKNEDGIVTHFIGIQNDITRKVKTQAEVNHLVRIFNESLNEIFVIDADSLKFTHANFGACRNSGYSLEELHRMKVLDLLTEYEPAEFRKLLEPIYEKSLKKIILETSLKRKDGTEYPVEVHFQSSIKGDKRVIVCIVLDVTDKRNYTERLEAKVEERTSQLKEALSREIELNELKTKFLSMVSHEFKTPLSAILTSATLVGKYCEVNAQEKRVKHLKTIKSEVKHLNNILNDFLSIEKFEKGKEVYNLTKFSLSKVIDEVIYNANMILKVGQRISYPQGVDELTVCQDEKIVSLVLTNLLYNSIKYSPEDTLIDLQVNVTKDTLQFQVRDEGIGIPEKDQKFIFDRYFRAGNVLLTQGTGIGLNIVKTHVETLGGSINFESTENKGTTFTVQLPLNEKACS